MTHIHWTSAKIDPDLAALLNDVVASTPGIESKSDIARAGIRLYLSELLRENRITDTDLKLRLYEYLHRTRPSTVTVNGGRNA